MDSYNTHLHKTYLQGIQEISRINFASRATDYSSYELTSPTTPSVTSFSSSSSSSSKRSLSNISSPSIAGSAHSWTASRTPSRQTSNSSSTSISTDPAHVWTPDSSSPHNGPIFTDPESYSSPFSPSGLTPKDSWTQLDLGNVTLGANTVEGDKVYIDENVFFSHDGPMIPGYGKHDAMKGCNKLICSCGSQFRGRYGPGNFQRHIKTIQNREKNWQLVCKYCGSTFSRSDNLNQHHILIHKLPVIAKPKQSRKQTLPPVSVPGQQYECPTCHKIFSMLDAYNEHVVTCY